MAVKKKRVTRPKDHNPEEGTPIYLPTEGVQVEFSNPKPLSNPPPKPEPEKKTPIDDPGVMWVTVKIPVSPFYEQNGDFRKVTHIELNNFKYHAGAGAFAIYNGLRDINAEIDAETRRPVSSFSHMAMYVFDQVFHAMEDALEGK